MGGQQNKMWENILLEMDKLNRKGLLLALNLKDEDHCFRQTTKRDLFVLDGYLWMCPGTRQQ